MPDQYRGVAVARVDGRLDEPDELRAHFLGREAYRTTRFLVVRPRAAPDGGDGGPVALLAVGRAPGAEELFSPITTVEVLAGPHECAYLHRPEVDTAVPSAVVAAALDGAAGVRAVVVQGRYEHVSFVVGPDPRRVVVREVVPPRPPKLADQAARVLAVAEDLPPVRLEVEATDLADLALRRPAAHYLLPCRGGGNEITGAALSYLDERPERADWTLLGCERSRQIHRWFYGSEPDGVDFCPKRDVTSSGPGMVLTKCCLQQDHVENGVLRTDAGQTRWASVPWGATLDHVREALGHLAREPAEASWSPA